MRREKFWAMGTMMYKIMSLTESDGEIEVLESAEMDLFNAMLILSQKICEEDIPEESAVRKVLVDTRDLIASAKLKISEMGRPRSLSGSSSIGSVKSLGDRIAGYDKEYLYTYKWGKSLWSDRGQGKGDFQKWLEGGFKLPPKGSVLNCWEAVIVNLYLYNAFDKHELLDEFREGKRAAPGKAIERDADIISSFLGFWTPENKVDRIEDVKPGDIISFKSQYGTENAHVAIVFEEGESVKLGSFWTIPKEKMILVSPEKIVAVCLDASEGEDSRFEPLDLEQVQISSKFRAFFQSLTVE